MGLLTYCMYKWHNHLSCCHEREQTFDMYLRWIFMIYFLLLGHCQQTYRTEKLTISKNIFVDLLTSRWGGGKAMQWNTKMHFTVPKVNLKWVGSLTKVNEMTSKAWKYIKNTFKWHTMSSIHNSKKYKKSWNILLLKFRRCFCDVISSGLIWMCWVISYLFTFFTGNASFW